MSINVVSGQCTFLPLFYPSQMWAQVQLRLSVKGKGAPATCLIEHPQFNQDHFSPNNLLFATSSIGWYGSVLGPPCPSIWNHGQRKAGRAAKIIPPTKTIEQRKHQWQPTSSQTHMPCVFSSCPRLMSPWGEIADWLGSMRWSWGGGGERSGLHRERLEQRWQHQVSSQLTG